MPENKLMVLFHSLVRRVHFSWQMTLRVLIVVTLIGLLGLMFPRGESIDLEYKVGSVWAQKDLNAPFAFPIFKEEKVYLEQVAEAKLQVYPVFEKDEAVAETELRNLNALFDKLSEALKFRARLSNSSFSRDTRRRQDSIAFVQSQHQLSLQFTEPEWELLADLSSSQKYPQLERITTDVVFEFYRLGILDRDPSALNRSEIALRKGTLEEILPSSNFYAITQVPSIFEAEFFRRFNMGGDTLSVAKKIALHFIVPTIKLNNLAMELSTAAAVDAVPKTVGFVQEIERIVSKHERITPETRLKLESLRRAKLERGAGQATPLQLLGIVLHVAIVIVLFGIYLYLFRKKIFNDNRRLALIALIFLMQGFFAFLTRELPVDAPMEYLIFVPAASMLLTIIFDSRVGFYSTVILAFVVAGIRGNDYSVALAALVAGALSVYTVRDVKNRTQIIRSFGFILLGYAIAIAAMALERLDTLDLALEQLLFASANAIISPVLTYGLLIFFERYFRVTTDLTLIELSHFHHPLLRLLADRAPGTHHHSMSIAGLAEAAAAAVGANEVLARVGAYFHDIGKIEKPTYFVENQKGPRNRHDKLSPRMSSLIITNHVKEGIALAREYNLPEEIIEFIPAHHGTTRVEFFYRKALKNAESSEDETKIDEIKEQDYRYPGPKPQTKETGILMLADAIEAVARTIEDPSPQKLEAAIDELVRKRFEEGELDECPLTLKDLTKIKAAFLNVLVGVYHTRIKYPGEKD